MKTWAMKTWAMKTWAMKTWAMKTWAMKTWMQVSAAATVAIVLALPMMTVGAVADDSSSTPPSDIPSWGQIDPTLRPGLFDALPIPGKYIASGEVDGLIYMINEDGLVMGQTPFGYAYFTNLKEYIAFSRKYN